MLCVFPSHRVSPDVLFLFLLVVGLFVRVIVVSFGLFSCPPFDPLALQPAFVSLVESHSLLSYILFTVYEISLETNIDITLDDEEDHLPNDSCNLLVWVKRTRKTAFEQFDSSDHIASEEGQITLMNVSYIDEHLFVWEVLPFTYASLFHLLTLLMTQSVVMNNRSAYYNGESKSS